MSNKKQEKIIKKDPEILPNEQDFYFAVMLWPKNYICISSGYRTIEDAMGVVDNNYPNKIIKITINARELID